MEEEIGTMAAHIHAVTYRFLMLVADFVRRRGWELGGHRTPAHWLHHLTGFSLGTSREKIRVAQALGDLPLISAEMARGRLSFSKVRALTRVADPENEADLLEVARDSTTAQLERYVRALRKGTRLSEAAIERENHRLRRFRVWPDDGGMYVVEGRVPPEVGAVLMRAIEAGTDALFCKEAKDETTPEQRRADALGLVAEQALAAGFGTREEEEPEVGGDEHRSGEEPSGSSSCHGDDGQGDGMRGEGQGTPEEEDARPAARVSAETQNSRRGPSPALARAPTPAPLTGSRAERYQVFIHVDEDTLKKDGDGVRSNLEDGVRVSAETSRRLSCDCSTVRVVESREGEVLDVGRRTRTIPPAIRRALEIRDQGCRWPGCGLRFTQGHHIEHWIDGGETRLRNLISLCRFHHRKVHEDGWAVCYNPTDNTALFFGPRGIVRAHRPPRLGRPPRKRRAHGNGKKHGNGKEHGHGHGRARGAADLEGAGSPGETGAPGGTRRATTGAAEAGATETGTAHDPVQRVIDDNRRHGVEPGPLDCCARDVPRSRHPWEREA